MKSIRLFMVAAGLATLAGCSGGAANNADNSSLTEGIVINNAEIYANDANAADNAADANAANAVDANAMNAAANTAQ